MISENNTEEIKIVSNDTSETAAEAVAKMKIGWNLGNTFDCHGSWFDQNLMETAWGNPYTTTELIHYIHSLGFEAIRMPVTWYPHMDERNNLDFMWMRRVKKVVGMILKEGMYCIVNCHHDTGEMQNYGGGWIQADIDNFKKNRNRVEQMWTQIAELFRDESDKLLLEGFNEMLNPANQWNTPTGEELNAVNDWNRLFVETVRKTGGANRNRNLILNTYAGGLQTHLLQAFQPPKDIVEGHLIMGIHCYDPWGFTTRNAVWTRQTDLFDDACEQELQRLFDQLKINALSKKIPVIIGEFASMDKNNEQERAKHADFMVTEAGKLGIPCFYWDDGKMYRIVDRLNLSPVTPELVKTMISAAERIQNEKNNGRND